MDILLHLTHIVAHACECATPVPPAPTPDVSGIVAWIVAILIEVLTRILAGAGP